MTCLSIIKYFDLASQLFIKIPISYFSIHAVSNFLQITLPHEALRHLVQLARAYRPVTASGLLDN